MRAAIKFSGILAGLLSFLTVNTLFAEVPPVEVPPSLHTEVPGKIQLVAWGWLGSVYYQVVPFTGYDVEEYKARIIDEPAKWGANLLEFYPPYFHQPGGVAYPMPWPNKLDDFPRPQRYMTYDDPRWNREALIDLIRYCHNNGFLIQWFLHPKPVSNSTFEQNLLAWRYLARTYADSLTMPVKEVLDGMGWEVWFEDKTGRTAEQLWLSNPGMYCYSTHTRPKPPAPNYSKTYMCANPGRPMGRDDQYGMQDTPIGSIPLTYQADARPKSLQDTVWSATAFFSQGTFPDWILKQAEDFFRRQIIAGDKLDAHSIWWLGEPEATLDPFTRRYVYVASLDPIRHAATAPLWTTGLGGYSDRLHEAIRMPIRHRYEFPFDSTYIGNNYLRVYRRKDRDAGSLKIDPGRTGEYDHDSEVITLSDGFLDNPSFNGDGAKAEMFIQTRCEPPRKVFKAEVSKYTRNDSPTTEKPLWVIGQFNASRAELSREGGFDEVFKIQAKEAAKNFPSVMAPGPRGPNKIHVHFQSAADAAYLLIGQKSTGITENVMVSMNGRRLGHLTTRKGKPNEFWLHKFGPFHLPEQKEAYVTLTWDGRGGGFEFDALALVEEQELSKIVGDGPAPDEVKIPWTERASIPGGLSADGKYPRELKLMINLKPGRYVLELEEVRAQKPTPVTLLIDEKFGPGFGHRPENEPADKKLPFTIDQSGQHILTLKSNLEPDIAWKQIRLVRLHDVSINHEFVEPGGHLAHMRERLSNGKVSEQRDYHVISDFPAIQINIQRQNERSRESELSLGFRASHLCLNGKPLKSATRRVLPDSSAYFVLNFKDDRRKIGMKLTEYPKGTIVKFDPEQCFDLMFPSAGKVNLNMQIGLIGQLYGKNDLERAMAAAYQTENVDDLPAEISNPLSVPVVRIAKVRSQNKRPYVVRESGNDGVRRWIARGAQPALTAPGFDYVKIYLQPANAAKLAEYTWYAGVARPVHGCQHILALSDISGDGQKAQCTAKVMQIAPHVFSPGINFKKPIVSARLNGKPWAYFEENILRLPCSKGEYKIQVQFTGEKQPHLQRTCALVKAVSFKEGRLQINAQLPPWSNAMPGNLPFTFLINGENRSVSQGREYKIQRTADHKGIISAEPGEFFVELPYE